MGIFKGAYPWINRRSLEKSNCAYFLYKKIVQEFEFSHNDVRDPVFSQIKVSGISQN